MKGSDKFKETIKAYLDKRAETDVLFSFQYSKPEKNIDDCITYILNTVKQSGCNGFSDDEIYSMAVHFFDEDNIDIGNPINAHVVAVVNHVVELTAEEKAQAHREAMQRAQEEAYRKMTQPTKKKAKTTVDATLQPSLFDL
ncbi:PcfK-like family protein [Porphyromonas gingivalis]|uniref:PcfK-like family protein n=1 Tax=Porphyromonas gingivalis TaxID=837 RepID=A0AAE9X4G8_PORGN|nr:PcfK-like family protein [Porphyromonas gingivalis]AIJ35207.1 PcfK-like protein [Porphyromonas gingivalis]WCF98174.1 PcfK-like family protein [Porphyromonas gingivalis]